MPKWELPTVEQVLAVARKELGYKESPANSNKTKYGKWYGLDGKPWCMMFIMWVFSRSGGEDLLPTLTASCGDFMRSSKKAGRWITVKYRAGDVLILDFPGGGRTDHTGLVEKVSNGILYTIEGNTGTGNNTNGGMVMRRTRKPSQVVGAFRPRYTVKTEKKSFFTIGTLVNFFGGKLYTGSGEESVSKPAAACTVTIDSVRSDAAHPYYVHGADGVEGWVDASAVDAVSKASGSGKAEITGGDFPMRVKVTAKPYLRVRSGPGTNYAHLFSVQCGDVITITEIRSGWGKLADDGWVRMKYVVLA